DSFGETGFEFRAPPAVQCLRSEQLIDFAETILLLASVDLNCWFRRNWRLGFAEGASVNGIFSV
ncbi:hypothetical protein LINPERPRIM_LOCUS12997, partial [Linum perenne]